MQRATVLKPDLRPQLQTALVGPYTIERELGRGGMTLLAQPYFLSPAWLRIDPNFAPLRSHPRFQKLISETP